MSLSHIFCGEIGEAGDAQGFHSEVGGAVGVSVKTKKCKYKTDGNGVCKYVYVRNSDGEFIKKRGSSSLFNLK